MSKFVKADPLRDPNVFCNSPPCPLCFDLVDEVENKPRSGLEEFYCRMVGTYSPPPELKATLDKLAKEIHERNLLGYYDPKGMSPEDAVARYDNAQEEKKISLQAKGTLQALAKEKVVSKRKKTVLLDNVKITIKEQRKTFTETCTETYGEGKSALEIMMEKEANEQQLREIRAKYGPEYFAPRKGYVYTK